MSFSFERQAAGLARETRYREIASIRVTPLPGKFRYPISDEDLLRISWAGDFLRTTRHYPNRVDPQYLMNQRDAANYFIEWLLGPQGDRYEDMLRNQHRVAALGRDGRTPYDIISSDSLTLRAVKVDGAHIEYSCLNKNSYRETYAGTFRSELEEKGIEHPAIDYRNISRRLLKQLMSCDGPTAASGLVTSTGPRTNTLAALDESEFRVFFRDCSITCPVRMVGGNAFHRHAPAGSDYATLLEYAGMLIGRIRSRIQAGLAPSSSTVAEYYHAAINLTPFSNINNSILMAQVNSIRRLSGLRGIPHGELDWLAFLTSWSAFIEIYESQARM